MVTIITKEKQDLKFDNSIQELFFFTSFKTPFIANLNLNIVEFISGGILEINKQVYSFDHIYLNINKNHAYIMAENLNKILKKPKIDFKNNNLRKTYERKIKSYEDSLSEGTENVDTDFLLLELQKKLAMYFYLKWKDNIWK